MRPLPRRETIAVFVLYFTVVIAVAIAIARWIAPDEGKADIHPTPSPGPAISCWVVDRGQDLPEGCQIYHPK